MSSSVVVENEVNKPSSSSIRSKWLCGAGDNLLETMTACTSKPLRSSPLTVSDSDNASDESQQQKKAHDKVLKSGQDKHLLEQTSCSRNVGVEENRPYNQSHPYSSGFSSDDGTLKVLFSPSSFFDVETMPLEKKGPLRELGGSYNNYRLHPEFVSGILRFVNFTIPAWFQNPVTAKPVGVYSEPCSANVKVRGKGYLTDNMKVMSAPSTFAILGADKFVRRKGSLVESSYHICNRQRCLLNRLRLLCSTRKIKAPFLLVFNFVLPWGNFLMYSCRPDGDLGGPFNSKNSNEPDEKALRSFLQGSKLYRDSRLKLISSINNGPFVVKKMVGSKPAIIGQKVETSYFGSIEEGYIEICLDVCKGSKLAHSITSAVCGHADHVTVDVGFTIEGTAKEFLPERLLCNIRLHHMALKKGCVTLDDWEKHFDY